LLVHVTHLILNSAMKCDINGYLMNYFTLKIVKADLATQNQILSLLKRVILAEAITCLHGYLIIQKPRRSSILPLYFVSSDRAPWSLPLETYPALAPASRHTLDTGVVLS